MKLKNLAALAASAICFTLTACSSGSSSPTSLIDPATVSGELVIVNSSDTFPAQTSLRNAGSAFTAEYPNVSIRYIHNDINTHRDTITDSLTSNSPDVIAWYPGNIMEPLIDASLLDSVSDIWSANNLGSHMPSSAASMTRNGEQWGIPISTYGWGVYYRKDIFETLGMTEPATWEDFKSVAETLKANGVTPLTIGTKFSWPTAGVFDHLNLRTNGHAVHNALTAGEIKYTDARIREVFVTWKEMVDSDYFVEDHESMSWLDAISPMVTGDAAMYIMGNFLTAQYDNAGGSIDDLGFFQFPQISSSIPRAEEAPMDALFLPKNAQNKDAARAFLDFVSRPENQAEWNKTLKAVPPHKNAELFNDSFVAETAATINSATALSHFFDRDAPAAMALPALSAFTEFMLDTTKLDSILMRLDTVQESAY